MNEPSRNKNIIVKKKLDESDEHILNSGKTLKNWSIKQHKSHFLTKQHDPLFATEVFQLLGNDTCYLDYPANQLDSSALYPCCVFIFKILQQPFILEFSLEDTDGLRRRLTLKTDLETTTIKNFTVSLPLRVQLDEWQHLLVNFDKLTKQLFNAVHSRTHKIRVYGNCQLYRIYFSRTCRPGENVLI